MKFSMASKLIGLTLVVYIVCDVLLTPVAHPETRPVAAVMLTGFAVLSLLFIGLGLAVVDLVLVSRRARRAQVVAIIVVALYFPTAVADQTGLFSSLRPPAAISWVELTQVVVAVTLFDAGLWRMKELSVPPVTN